MGKYGNMNNRYGDHDLELNHSNAEIAYQLNNIANELAEHNRLKRLELTKVSNDHYTDLVDEA